MIRHVVVWRLLATTVEEKALAARQIIDVLSPLGELIPGIRAFTIGPNVAYFDTNWDLALVSDYDSLDALEAYQVHPAHREAAAVVRSLVADRASVDFEL